MKCRQSFYLFFIFLLFFGSCSTSGRKTGVAQKKKSCTVSQRDRSACENQINTANKPKGQLKKTEKIEYVDQHMEPIALLVHDHIDPLPEWKYLDSEGLDFSIESLENLNRYLDQLRKNKKDETVDWNKVVLRLGAYVGEVVRKAGEHNQKNWHWVTYEEATKNASLKGIPKQLGSAIILYEENGGFCFPLAKVVKYLNNGEEEDLIFFAKIMAKGLDKIDQTSK